MTACELALPGTDPLGPRECECELFKEWAAALPLTPEGVHVESDEVSVAELVNGFRLGASRPELDSFVADEFIASATSTGLNHEVEVDRDDHWQVAFFPGPDQKSSRWSMRVTMTGGGVGLQVGVTVEGSPWELETIEDVWDSYSTDRDAALAAQEERQQQAIDTLRPLQTALDTLVAEP